MNSFLSLLLKWIHLIATVAWIGGMFSNFFIYLPAIGKTMEPPAAGKLMAVVMKRFRVMVYISMAVFLLTGILLASLDLNTGVAPSSRNEITTILIFKIPLFVVMMILAVAAFEIVAPGVAKLAQAGPSPRLKKAQRSQKILAVTGFLLGLIILALSAAF